MSGLVCSIKFLNFRWGHETLQHAKSENRVLKSHRNEVALKASNLIWDYMMAQHYKKHSLVEAICTPFPPNIMLILKDTQEAATHMVGHPSHEGEVRVTDREGFQYIVNLCPEWKCICGNFQDFCLPYMHGELSQS